MTDIYCPTPTWNSLDEDDDDNDNDDSDGRWAQVHVGLGLNLLTENRQPRERPFICFDL